MPHRSEEVFAICYSKTLALDEISQLIGADPDENCSHTIGDERGLSRVFEGSLWRREAAVDESASIEKQFDSLLPVLDMIHRVKSWPDDVRTGIEIVIFSTSPAPTLLLSPDLQRECCTRDLEIEVCFYYCSEEDD